MNQKRRIYLKKLNFNIPALIIAATVIIGSIYGWGVFWGSVFYFGLVLLFFYAIKDLRRKKRAKRMEGLKLYVKVIKSEKLEYEENNVNLIMQKLLRGRKFIPSVPILNKQIFIPYELPNKRGGQ